MRGKEHSWLFELSMFAVFMLCDVTVIEVCDYFVPHLNRSVRLVLAMSFAWLVVQCIEKYQRRRPNTDGPKELDYQPKL